MIRFSFFTAAVLALVTACSSGGGTGGGSMNTPPGGSSVTITMSSGHLVGPNGHTLYLNSADTAKHLICTGSCLSIWPPVLGSPVAGHGVSGNQLSTIKRGSHTQVTYAGHPLYQFSADTKAGDEKGNGLTDQGGTWSPAGSSGQPAPSQGGGGGGGYGYP